MTFRETLPPLPPSSRPFLRAAVFLFALLAAAAPLFGRDLTIVVQDADFGTPLEGALVHTWDNRRIAAGRDGAALLSLPDTPASLPLRITYPGYKTERVTVGAAAGAARLTVILQSEQVHENEELVFTAERAEEGVAVEAGRSVTLAGRELSRSAEIGLVEDVMTAVKLLPGVGYTGMFNAQPSIRGGDPGDLTAALDGYYIENPYFWGGGMSIFDPHMIESVKLSHGIFSTSYGHSISGLLELSSKKPSATETEIELGVSTSSTNLNIALPFKKGGLMIMGKTTYWDGYIALLRALSGFVDALKDIEAVTTAPYIRAAALSGSWRLNADSEITLNGFLGADGVGASYKNQLDIDGITQDLDTRFIWDNLQGFLIAGLTISPHPAMVMKTTLGGGFATALMDAAMHDNLYLTNSGAFRARMEGAPYNIPPPLIDLLVPSSYKLNQRLAINLNNTTYGAQGRFDYDWEPLRGIVAAAGVQGWYTRWTDATALNGPEDFYANNFVIPGTSLPSYTGYINSPLSYENKLGSNSAVTSGAYALAEYAGAERKFAAEAGLRVDHLYFLGDGFSIQSYPALNPRLNLDYNVLRNKGPIDSFDLTAGTGLFSSMTDNIKNIRAADGIGDYELKQNRSWTSLLGIRLRFLEKWSFNIEGYYKRVFDRAYTITPSSINSSGANTGERDYLFDGEGHIFGFDFMLQKFESKYLDGWIAYTFTHARYFNPLRVDSQTGEVVDGYWRYPWFHRFHNLNVVLNVKPSKRYNIALRLGFASGAPLPEAGEIESYPVLVMRPGEDPFFIEKYKRESLYSDLRRDGYALPVDIKISFFTFTKAGKTQGEFYLAAENALAFLKTKTKNTSFNQYTGTEVEGSDTANYQMPVPMVSFGYTWSY